MPLTLVDMSFVKHAQALTSLSAGTQALVNNIIAESNSSNISTPGGSAAKEAFFNHNYDVDPSTGGKASLSVNVKVYYMPSNYEEYKYFEVIDKAVGLLSGRRRLITRESGGKYTFYTTGHPKDEPIGLRTNSYTNFVPIDTKR